MYLPTSACLGRVLGEIYAAVQSGILVTKR